MRDYGTASGHRDYVHELECLPLLNENREDTQNWGQIKGSGGGTYSGNCDILGRWLRHET